jgi:transposase
MEHGTTLLLGLEGVAVVRVDRAAEGTRVVHVVTADASAAGCPSCGTVSTSSKQHVTTSPKDLPYGEDGIAICWHKRRWRCREERCPRSSFTEQVPEVPAGARVTGRLRRACAAAVEAGRCVSEVASAHGLSWPTVQAAVDAHAAERLGEPEPTPVLGIDETRFGAPRWVRVRRADGTTSWTRVDPWETGFVDLTGAQGLLGQVDGRRRRSVIGWLTRRDQAFRDAIQVVAVDPSAPYASAVRRVLPHAAIAVDPFHPVALANQAVTKVRQRVTRDRLGRRGRATDRVWANRRLLLCGRERLSPAAFARMWKGTLDVDPDGEILAAWIAKEELRALLALAGGDPTRHEIAHRHHRFFT